ncbi:mandelate racemase/muconate lactonizing enzyme family protein [Variovorax sp. J22G21]|uniref:mandelate racemase/muconate lactonizing enzyme family protein n=1 Tax=Variovorax fucosicus TaxID=3053517 RepID=UPI00257774DF|nr:MULTISPECIES: mandelate racemase/muconate lactonizing enzyme family protein [unclassified Variovorax]MDM0037712.1 mandelate racemase/muconate lactonizing enzyme family protein [Variovorax sp. J22R193]MDM0062488.1 mandelate racemase/muconate lactonizing enzyme family protein [Variovorax sp. J22G21]
MKITQVDTVHVAAYPNILWLQIHTDSGLVGLGETFRGAQAVQAQIHELVAPYLLGKDALAIEAHHHHLLHGYIGFASSGVETRAASAVDIALWDLLGQVTQQPLYQLLGGAVRERVPVYNTCAGYTYNKAGQRRAVTDTSVEVPAEGPYEDQVAFVKRPAELAESLLREGYKAMKIWPFDPFAQASRGQAISARDLETALHPFREIRRAVGDEMDIMVELHSMWNLPMAVRIAQALEEFKPYWAEDPIQMTNLDTVAEYRSRTRIPVCASETLATRQPFIHLLKNNAVDYVMLDLSWVGGISEAKKIAAIAQAFHKPVAPHDCTGPVVLAASLHLAMSTPNVVLQEVVRAYLSGWYRDLVTQLPEVRDGHASVPPGAGLGMALAPALLQRPDVTIRSSVL